MIGGNAQGPIGPTGATGPQGPAVSGGRVLYLSNQGGETGTYEGLAIAPDTDPEEVMSCAVDNVSGEVLFQGPTAPSAFVTESGFPGVAVIDPGVWEIQSYAYTDPPDTGGARVHYKLYKANAGLTTETLLFTFPSSQNLGTSPPATAEIISTVQPAIALDPTDRLVLKAFGVSDGSPAETHDMFLYHSGTARYTRLITPIAAAVIVGPTGPTGPTGPAGAAGATGAANISGTTGKLIKFTAATTGGDALVSESGSVITLAGSSVTTGRAQNRTAQGGGWKDMLGDIRVRAFGPTAPTLAQVGSSNLWRYRWAIGNFEIIEIHVPHDYALGTDVYFHVHWQTVGASTNTVKWAGEFWYARGYGVQSFNLGSPGTTFSVEAAPTSPSATNGSAHMVTETGAFTIPNLEPDGSIAIALSRVTNGGSNNTDDVFCWNCDVHYQSTEKTSANRNGPWGT